MVVEKFDRQSNRQHFANVRDSLTARRRELTEDDVALDERIAVFAAMLHEARTRVSDWPIGEDFDSLAPGLKKTYRRGRKAMAKASDEPGTENFHEWRKRAKYHRYHVRVLRPIWGEVLDEWQRQLHGLTDDLGDDHDLAVFGETLSKERERFASNRDVQALLGLCDRRRAQLQARAFPLGQRTYAEKPKHLVRRFHAYWQASGSDSERGTSKLEAHVEVPADE